jgi:hypothetical protein
LKNRILAIDFVLMGANRKPVSVVLPVLMLQLALQRKRFVKISLLNLRDALMLRNLPVTKNYLWASMPMGLRSINRDLVLGPFGVNHINDAERESHDLLSAKGMCSAATSFQKPAHASWRHLRGNNGHQLDHFLISRRELSYVSDVGLSKLTCTSTYALLGICQSSMNQRQVTSIAVCCEILLSQEIFVTQF